LLQTKKSNPKDEITTSPSIDYAWAEIVWTTSSNAAKLKLVKFEKMQFSSLCNQNTSKTNSWVQELPH
jgi:hypothetical protein